MLVKFRSKAAADVTMYEEHAKQILDLLNKDVKRGIITAAEAAGAIDILEKEIAESKLHPEDQQPDTGMQNEEQDDDKEQQRRQHVSFATRVYPLLEMLRAAQKGKYDVMWGIY
jgi:hypothetical protein